MKKTILGSMFSYIGSSILALFFLFSTIGLVCPMYIYSDPLGFNATTYILIIFIFGTLYFWYIYLKRFLQWIRIDGEYIMSKNIFGIIKKVHVKDIEEAKLVSINFSSPGSALQWIVLFSDADEKMTKGLTEKNSPIYVKYTKKHLKIIEEFLGKPVDRE